MVQRSCGLLYFMLRYKNDGVEKVLTYASLSLMPFGLAMECSDWTARWLSGIDRPCSALQYMYGMFPSFRGY